MATREAVSLKGVEGYNPNRPAAIVHFPSSDNPEALMVAGVTKSERNDNACRSPASLFGTRVLLLQEGFGAR